MSTSNAISQTVTALRKMVPPLRQQPSIKARVEERRWSSPQSSHSAMWYRARGYPSPFDLSAGFGIGLDIESRCNKVYPFMNLHRAAMSPEQRACPRVLIKQAPYGQSDSFSLVSTRQPLGCFFYERHDFRTGDGHHIRH
jgi:hypothetical protein